MLSSKVFTHFFCWCAQNFPVFKTFCLLQRNNASLFDVFRYWRRAFGENPSSLANVTPVVVMHGELPSSSGDNMRDKQLPVISEEIPESEWIRISRYRDELKRFLFNLDRK